MYFCAMQRFYQYFFHALPVRKVEGDTHLSRLNPSEARRVKAVRRWALAIAAGFSVVGFLLYYLPVYFYPEYFPKAPVSLPFFVVEFELGWGEILWGIILMVIELYLLVLLNIWGVHEISVATGFLNEKTKPKRTDTVLDLGLENRAKEIVKYGIDPFQGLNKTALFFFAAFQRLKGWLGNKMLRFLIQRLLGRFAVREVLDFIGMPMYMAINAQSTHVVLRQAQLSIMGQALIQQFIRSLPDDMEVADEHHDFLYDTLQFIAVSKRDYHQNHYLLTRSILGRFGVSPRKEHLLPPDFVEKIKSAPEDLKKLCSALLLLGFILDGSVSYRERKRIDDLKEEGLLTMDYRTVKKMARQFENGLLSFEY